MGLNIKNPDVERDIRRLAELNGTSLTETVAAAVETALIRAQRDIDENRMTPQRLVEFLRAIEPRPTGHSSDLNEMYDEHGLPL